MATIEKPPSDGLQSSPMDLKKETINPSLDIHLKYMQQALHLARQSPPKPTNYRVGAILVSPSNTILSTGYTLEMPGNTHAEQSCFIKLALAHNVPESRLAEVLEEGTVLYTTVEPCFKRSKGNIPCVERILALGGKVNRVYVGVKEPEKFVGVNTGGKMLERRGVEVVAVGGMEEEILRVAMAGHVPEPGPESKEDNK